MASDRANPASPWPDIRRESWLERLRRGVSTARAYPLHERGANQGPLGVAVNDLAASVPLPEDFSAMGDMAMRLMDPTGMYGNADAQGFDAAGALANPENLRAMMEYAGEHPVQTMASAFGGPAGIAAYREFVPQSVRNYAHLFYGGGRPLHYVREPLRKAAIEGAPNEFPLFAGQRPIQPISSWNVNDRLPQPFELNVRQSAKAAGVEPPEWVGIDSYYDYPGRKYSGMTYEPTPSQREWTDSFGKAYVKRDAWQSPDWPWETDAPSAVWDWYQFFPSAYGVASGKDMLSKQASLLKREVRNALWNVMHADATTVGRRGGNRLTYAVEQARPSAALASNLVTAAIPRALAMEFGTPYPIDASLRSADALMEGLAPFSAIGATGEMLPPWMRSAAQPDAVRRER